MNVEISYHADPGDYIDAFLLLALKDMIEKKYQKAKAVHNDRIYWLYPGYDPQQLAHRTDGTSVTVEPARGKAYNAPSTASCRLS